MQRLVTISLTVSLVLLVATISCFVVERTEGIEDLKRTCAVEIAQTPVSCSRSSRSTQSDPTPPEAARKVARTPVERSLAGAERRHGEPGWAVAFGREFTQRSPSAQAATSSPGVPRSTAR